MPQTKSEYMKDYYKKNTEKHKALVNNNRVTCDICVITCRKCDFNRHLRTAKHKKLAEKIQNNQFYRWAEKMEKLFGEGNLDPAFAEKLGSVLCTSSKSDSSASSCSESEPVTPKSSSFLVL